MVTLIQPLIQRLPQAGLCTLLLALLTACAAPSPPMPPMLTASQLSLSTLPQSPDFARGAWWRALRDPVLDQLLEHALVANPKLTLAAAKVAAAQANEAIAASGSGPTVNAQASFNRQRYSADGLIPPPIAGTWQNYSQIGASLNYSFDLWGKIRERVAAAAGASRAAELEQASAQQWLAAEVVTQYLVWRAAQQEIMLQQAALLASEQLAQKSKTLKRAGLVSRDAQNEQTLLLAEARTALIAAQLASSNAQAALAALTLTRQADLAAQAPRALPAWPINTNDLRLNQLAQRPELLAAKYQVESAAALVRAAQADFYPDISLSALIGLSSLSTATLFDSASRRLGVTPAISLPIFEAGALQGALDLQHAHYASAIAIYNQTLLDIANDSASSLARQQAALKIETEAKLSETAAEQLANSARLRQRAGLSPASDTLQSHLSHVNSRLSLLQAQRDRLIAQTSLIRAMGATDSKETP
ncbi:efflux transporter outer membrane subunit [Deefgea piscis]|uniref:Efflux transporter outer membrane subunit n=1 Tax=Deefgea piscis TaxID=2739061 RepID=A0A6M8SPQ8_9NEIS|nr:efflux transporter outer membrane subunit [Deefgea piscis]QKJ66134.1 efflux transporter outer membrane subunit [Deefgea piscis]